MNSLPSLLAQAEPSGVSADKPVSNVLTEEMFLMCLAVGAVAVLLVLWAMFIRKPRPHRHRRYHHHDSDSERSMEADESVDEDHLQADGHEKRRRRRRREHRPRNPTLAETGGLPPIRTDKPPGSTSP